MEITREFFENLKKEAFFKGKVVTGSMIPVIEIGEFIVIDIGARDLKRFDIIVFFREGKLICHYLWQMNKRVEPMLLQTRAMNGGRDFPIRLEDYLGKVVSHKLSTWQKIKILFRQ